MKYIVLFFFPIVGFTQNQVKLDSLKISLNHTQDFTQKTKIAHQIVDGYMKNQPDSTLKYIKISLDFAKKSKNAKLEARTYQLNANLLHDQNKYEESLKLSQKAKDLYEKINDMRGVGTAYNNMGFTYKKMGEAQNVVVLTKKGLEFVLKAIEILTTAHDTLNLIRAYNHSGIIYRDLKDFEKAKVGYETGLQMSEKYHVENPVVGVMNANLGQYYIDTHKNYDAAIVFLQKALIIYQKSNYQQGIEHAYRNLADAFRLKKDFKNAIDYAQKSVVIAQNLNDNYRLFNAYNSLYEAQKEAGFYKESLLSLEKAKDFEDSFIRVEKTKSIAEIETKYETAKKDAEITVLNKNAELDKIKKWSLILSFILLTITGAVLFNSFFQKRKRELIISEKDKAIEQVKLQNAQQELEFKKKELTAKVLQLARKNEFLSTIDAEIALLKSNVDNVVSKTSNRIMRLIENDKSDEKQWERFGSEFSSLHQGFIDALVAKFGELSKSEIRLISLLKMNLSSKDIADTLNISDEGIKKARYRLRKKLNLESENDLQGFLLSFSS